MSANTGSDKVDLISVGIDTSPIERDIRTAQAAIKTLEAELSRLEKAGKGKSSRVAQIKSEIDSINSLIVRTRAQSTELQAAAGVNEAYTKSLSAVTKANEGVEKTTKKVDKTVKSLNLTNTEAGQILSSLGAKAVPAFESISRKASATSSSVRKMTAALTATNPAAQSAAKTVLAALLSQEQAYDGMARRRLESVRGLTAENTELAKMRDYYRALETSGAAKNLKADMGKAYAAARDLSVGYDSIGKKVVGARELVVKFGEAQTRVFLGSKEYLVDLIPEIDRYVKKLSEASQIRPDKAEAATIYNEAYFKSRRQGFKALESQILATQQVLQKFGEEYSRVLLGPSKAGAITAALSEQTVQTLGRQLDMVKGIEKSVYEADKSIRVLSLTSTEAGQMLARYGSSLVSQFDAVSKNSSASSKRVKDAMASLYVGQDSPLTQVYRAFERIDRASANMGAKFSENLSRLTAAPSQLPSAAAKLWQPSDMRAYYSGKEAADAKKEADLARQDEEKAVRNHLLNLEGQRQQHYVNLRKIDKDGHYQKLSELKKLLLEEKAALALEGDGRTQGAAYPVVASAYGSRAADAAQSKGLEEIRRQIEAVTLAQKSNEEASNRAAVSQGRFSAAQWETHAAARGLAGSLGALWLTYGSLIPLISGAAIGSALSSMVKTGSEVEYQLAMIEAVGEGAKVSMAELAQATSGSVFSFGEATDALRILVQAGQSSADALQTLPSVLKLATIGEVELGKGALTVAAMLETFNLTVAETSRVTNTLAAAAASSPTSVDAMMEAMKQASSVSSQYSVSIEETSAALAVLAQRGIEGSAAGTAFRNLVKELAAPATKQAAEALQSMGISMFDANGSIKPLTTNLQQLADVAKLMSQEDRIKWFETFTNERSAKALDALVMDMDSFRQVTEEVTLAQEGLGFVTEANSKLMTTTSGQWKQLGADFQRVAAAVYQDLSPALYEFTVRLRDVVNSEGFKESLKGLADALISLTSFVTENAKAIGYLFAALAGHTVVKVAAESLKGLALILPGAAAGMTALAGAQTAFVAANASAGIAAGSFAAKIGGLGVLLTNPVVAGFAAATLAAGGLYLALRDGEEDTDAAVRAAEDFALKTDTLADAARRGAGEVDNSNRALQEQIQKFLEGARAADIYAQSTKNAFLSGLRTQEMTLRSEAEAERSAFSAKWNMSPEEAQGMSSLFTSRNEEADAIFAKLRAADRALSNIQEIETKAGEAQIKSQENRLMSSFNQSTSKAKALIERRNALIDAGNNSAAILASDTKLPDALKAQHERLVEAGKKASEIKPVDMSLFASATSDALAQTELMASKLSEIEIKPPNVEPVKREFTGLSDAARAAVSAFEQEIKTLDSLYAQFSNNLKAQADSGLISTPDMLAQMEEASKSVMQQKIAAAMRQAQAEGMNLTARQKAHNAIEQAENKHNEEVARLRAENVANLVDAVDATERAYQDAMMASATNVEAFDLEWASQYGKNLKDLEAQLAQTNPNQQKFYEILSAIQNLKFAEEIGRHAAAFRDLQEATDLASLNLDIFTEKSAKRGIFGILGGDAGRWSQENKKVVQALKAELDNLMAGPQSAAVERQIAELKYKIEEASKEVHPKLEEWGDSLGDYIANGIVYGFDEGESPAKAFANFLKREIYVALAQALSQQFKLNLVSVFGGGSGGASSGGGSSGGIGMPGIPGMDMMGMAANGLSWLGGATGLTGLSSFAAGMGMTSYTSAAAMTGLAEAGLVTGVTSGAAASAGSLLGGLSTAMPYVAAALFAAQALGLFDKKPSDKSSWASYDPTTGRTFDVGSMTGKKDPGQEQRDATAALAMLTGGFAGLAGIDASVTAMIGGRDGTRLRINRDEGTQGFLTPQAGLANGGNSLNYGNGEEAIRKMLDDLVDEGTLPQATIDAWRAAKTDMLGTARDAVELVSVLNLLTSDYDTATIERANLLQMEGEALEQAVGRMEQIEAVLGGNMLPGDAMASAAADMVKTLDGLALGSIPTTNEALGQIINSLDTTSEEGQKTYKTLMALAPGFIELQAAQEQMYNGLLTDEQRLSKAAGEYAEAFKQLGVAMPENREGLLDLLGSFDRTTESGARLYAQILALSAGFLETEEAAKQLEDQRTESYRKLLSDEENLALDRKNLADEFAKLGYTLPKSKEELRGWIDALNNSADVAGTEKERLQKIAEAYDKTFGGSTGFEAFINSAGQTEEEARKTANGLIALIEATLDYQEALDKSTEAARNAREEATRAYTATALDRRTEAIESLRSPDELAARDARQLAESSRGLTSSFEKLGFALPNSLEELRGFFEQIGGLPNWASTGPTAENALLDLVAPFIEYLELKEKVLGVDEATSSDDAIERARDNLRAAYEDQRASLEKTQDAMRSFVDSLKQYRTSLLMGDKSPLNPLEKYRLAQAEFETTSALAATGDEDALGKLQSVSDAFLDASRQMYASGAAYSLDFDKVLSALDAAGVAAGIEETLAQQSLEQLEIQVGALIDINESVLSVEQAIKELAEAFASGSTSGAYTQIADTYRTSLGRDPDSAGMAYWMTQHDKGTSVADIQTSIAGSAEAQLRSAYKEVLGRDPDSAGAAYWLTELQKGLSMDQLEQSLAYGAAPQDKAKALEWLQGNGLPGFANGGLHSGGLRVVGERGVEIEATGPARYWNFNQTQQMLGGSPELLAEVRALRAEVAALRQQQAAEHREAVAANYDASDRNAARISESTERVDRQRRTAERFA